LRKAAVPAVFAIAFYFHGLAFISLAGCAVSKGGTSDPGGNGTNETEAKGEEAKVHPDFDLTAHELETAVSGLPYEIRRKILAEPRRFLDLLAPVLAQDDPYLTVLVDKNHPLPESYEPDDLVDLSTLPLTVSRTGLRLRRILIPDLTAMTEAASTEGVRLVIGSAFRTYQYQATLYERNVNELGKEQADRESARPGTSQHQLGLTVDFGSITEEFANTAEGKWLAEHAWEYGFSLSYPQGLEELTGYMYEPWHFRYLARPVTELERSFFGGVQQRLLSFLHDQGDFFSERLRSGKP
jgi:D-alanyl-D-alanine carboxypeptidase